MLRLSVGCLVAFLVAGCSGGATCVAGATATCTCPTGGPGVQTCNAHGTFDGCTCTGSPDAGVVDAGTPDAGHCTSAAQCDDGVFCNGPERCAPGAAGSDARGCGAATTPACMAGENCREATQTCVTCAGMPDLDGDGRSSISCGGDDCDDNDPGVYPTNHETCDAMGRDEDCDPTTLGSDADTDTFVSALCCNTQHDGSLVCGPDCDDTTASVHPGAPENCNGVDDDCNGMVDDHPMSQFWPDLDGDLRGDVHATPVAACVPPPMTVPNGSDCDDTDPHVYPGATELCDGVHDDCTGGVGADTSEDADGDHHTRITATCNPGYPKDDCDDADPSVHPGATETCNGVDDDCDGTVDAFSRACTSSSGCGGTETCHAGTFGACVCTVTYPTITLSWQDLEGAGCPFQNCSTPTTPSGFTQYSVYVNGALLGNFSATRHCHDAGGTCGFSFTGSGTVASTSALLHAVWFGDGTDVIRVTKTDGGDFYYMLVALDFGGARPAQSSCLSSVVGGATPCDYSCPDDFAAHCGPLDLSWTPTGP